ncbi:MAG: 3-isopropylmalate dehydratase [Candidatus Bathyarchaeota archaeon]
MIIEGKALKYGDNISTDLIFPGKYMTLTNPEDLANFALAGLDSDFPKKIKSHGFLVAGKNFGCGSSREHAPLALKYAGTKCLIAESFARIFFRNAINLGLPVLECNGLSSRVSEGDSLIVNLSEGTVKNNSTEEIIQSKPLSSFLLTLLNNGGLIDYLNAKVK